MAEARDQLGRFMPGTLTFRSHGQVLRFFDDMDLVEPGVVPVSEWRPGSAAGAAAPAALWGGVARKP